ncbi:MAG: hypothetical protein FJX46_10825 [Alphaproteobacteria bacterium]|nr:hypothetical protein [Alphaproteobacteria bacterium]
MIGAIAESGAVASIAAPGFARRTRPAESLGLPDPTPRPAAPGENAARPGAPRPLVPGLFAAEDEAGGTETETAAEAGAAPKGQDGEPLDEAERRQVEELKRTDTAVRAHEQAHARVGGQYAGAPRYDYQTGPDGKRYAVAGEVSIDSSPVPGDPKATIAKLKQVEAAATAPADPSAQDRAVASAARAEIQKAQAELLRGEDGAEPEGKGKPTVPDASVPAETKAKGKSSAEKAGSASDGGLVEN